MRLAAMIASAILAVFFTAAASAQQPARLALLIGNKGYAAQVGRLKNPHNDIATVGRALTSIGFEVVASVRDATREDLMLAVYDFAEKLKSAGPNAIGFIYYSGHGVASGGKNYLLPVDVDQPSSRTIGVKGVSHAEILDKLQEVAPQAAHYLVLDACRNNLGGSRGSKGFIPEAQRGGVLIAFSAAPGTTASDEGDNAGPYATALAGELVKPRQTDLIMFHNVRVAVDRSTHGDQVPWIEDGIRRAERLQFATVLPPVVRIVSPTTGATFSAKEVAIEYALQSPSGVPVKSVFAEIDGWPVDGPDIKDLADARNEIRGTLNLKIPRRDVTLSIRAKTEYGVSDPASIELRWNGQASEKPRAYALTIGIGDYQHASLKLGKYPANDAQKLAAQMIKQEGLAYDEVEARVLTDAFATRKNIIEGLVWLRRRTTQPNSIAIIYFSGHVVTIRGFGDYWLPVDFDPRDLSTGLNRSEFFEMMKSMTADKITVLLFMDACSPRDASRVTEINGALGLNAETLRGDLDGVIAFASSAPTQGASANASGSPFTAALLNGLNGGAARPGEKVITTKDLSQYLERDLRTQKAPIFTVPSTAPVPLAGAP